MVPSFLGDLGSSPHPNSTGGSWRRDLLETLGRLSDQALVIPKWLDRATVANLVNWIQHLACWELQMSSLSEAIEFVGECFEDQIERRPQDRHDHQVQAEAQGPGQ